MGQKLAISAELDAKQAVELGSTRRQLSELRNEVRKLAARVDVASQSNTEEGGQHGGGTDAR